MDKLKFEVLSPQGKINYMNDKLKEGLTLTTISEEIKISKKTISKKLKEIGYTFSKQEKVFIKSNEYKPNTNIFSSKEATTKILDIIDNHDNIKEILDWYNNQRNVIEVNLSELKIDSDIKTTTVKLYTEVLGHIEFVNSCMLSSV